MGELLVPSRRGFLAGLGAVLAAPAIVRATSLMPVKALAGDQLVTRLDVLYGSLDVRPEWVVASQRSVDVAFSQPLSIDMITRESIKLFVNSNELLQRIAPQYDDAFAASSARIGSTLRIRLPSDYHVRD